MCARTKNAYGCGHSIKETNECHSSRCPGIQRFVIHNEGDCKACKSGGANITRGREGKGRYGQQIRKRSGSYREDHDPRQDTIPSKSFQSQIITVASTPAKDDSRESVSPWKSQSDREKEWHTPSRKRADHAWVDEHEARMTDLRSCLEDLRTSSPPLAPSPPRCHSPAFITTEEEIFEEPYNVEYRQPARSRKSSHSHVRVSLSPEADLQRRPTYHTRRHRSHDHADYQQVVHSTHRRKGSQQYELNYRPYTSDVHEVMTYPIHGSYDSHDAPVYGTRTEPYLPTYQVMYDYSSIPQVHPGYYQPVSGIDIISRVPYFRY